MTFVLIVICNFVELSALYLTLFFGRCIAIYEADLTPKFLLKLVYEYYSAPNILITISRCHYFYKIIFSYICVNVSQNL